MKQPIRLAIVCISLSLFCKVSNSQTSVCFSHDRGFYYSDFDLTLRCEQPGYSIKYTLDGSDPAKNENSFSGESPLKIHIDPYINQGRAITPGVIVRACAMNNQDTSSTETNTYIFPPEVKNQSEVSSSLIPYWPGESQVRCTYPDNLPNWMISDYQRIDLGVDPAVVHNEDYYSQYENALKSIPTISLVTDPESLFNDTTGIYINSTWSGIDWERAASIELIDPDDDGFQVNSGIRIRGGFSSSGSYSKHAFRVYFRDEYGNDKLRYPLFGNEGTDKFDKIDLRSSQNNSWHVGNGNADFIRDVFVRDIQRDMNQPYTRSQYYHLYLNGNYWGLFQTQERAEARFAESYFGGDYQDYDAVKSSGPSYDYPPYTLEATDGNLESSDSLYRIALAGFSTVNYNKVRGLNADGSLNPVYQKLLDEVNLIDYIIITYFIANTDGPAILLSGSDDVRINNFFAIYNRKNPDGFKYFVHDAEHTMNGVNDNITNFYSHAGETFESFNPLWLHYQLMQNEDYKQCFADRAYMHLFNNGELTSNKNIDRYTNRKNSISDAIIGESARWGSTNLNKNTTWIPVTDWFTNTYFPARTQIVIDQFKTAGWLNDILPPVFNADNYTMQSAGIICGNENFRLENPNSVGEIYYTTNNVDPRAAGGKISSDAVQYTNPVTLNNTVFLKARIKNNTEWSPMLNLNIQDGYYGDLIFSEINCNPPQQIIDYDTLTSKKLEFIEIKNNSPYTIDLSGYSIEKGINFVFPIGSSILPDSMIVIVSDSVSFKKFYSLNATGQYKGSLSNEGETINLINAVGDLVASVYYNSDGSWFPITNGAGYTLVYKDYTFIQSTTAKELWRPSTYKYGSPFKDDPAEPVYEVYFNEVLANSEYPQTDMLELYNNSISDIDISYWFISDDKDSLEKWQIPNGTIIPSKGFISFKQGHYEGLNMVVSENEFGNAFAISSAGESIYLCRGNSDGKILNQIAEFNIPPTLQNLSYGKFVDQANLPHELLLDTISAGTKNEKAWLSPVVFSEIMYHPDGNNFEYLTLNNRTDSIVNLFHDADSAITWKIDGIDYSFPKGISLEPGGSILVIEKNISPETVSEIINTSNYKYIFNFQGKLKNSSETLSLECPVLIDGDTANTFEWVAVEQVKYSDKSPWPANADGDGYALRRKSLTSFGNIASNWTSVKMNIPLAHAGFNNRVRIGNTVQLDGTRSTDSELNTLTYSWQLISKPDGSNASLSKTGSSQTEFVADEAGKYTFSLIVNNGEFNSIPAYVSIFATENREPTANISPTSYTCIVGEQISISPKQSYDPDYDVLSYYYELTEKPAGSDVVINSSGERTLNMVPDIEGKYLLELTVYDGEFYSNTKKFKVTAQPTSPVQVIYSELETEVYPNPAKRYINIRFTDPVHSEISIQLNTIDGKTVYEKVYGGIQVKNQQIVIDLDKNALKTGIYILSIRTNKYMQTHKILIN
ncbi:MAG: lamin tail domain-containing protein [Bacteroidales bacterium]|nr:lamin tail domain-containing protein [Bacteroidales bacterium]MBN2821015.1 lamin tail domain-containing protein [Bacteroidales bacterium]